MKKHSIHLLLIPGLIVITLLLFVPILSNILPTFIQNGGITLKRYMDFFTDDYFMSILMRTVRIGILTTIICVILGVPVSYYVAKSSKKMKGILLAAAIFPQLTDSVVRSFAWMTILGKNGVINKSLVALHIFNEPQKLLYTEFAIIVGSVYLFLPLMIISMVGVMDSIDDDLIEAAESLGANRFLAFLKVIFPLSVPGMIVGSVLVFTGTFTAYTTPQLLGGNKNTVLATLMYQKAMTLSDWTQASVLSTVMILITLAVMFFINKLSSKLYERGV
ncbi:ABC transporter permease [Clostridium sp. YIM B02515]|uniref:ABC transporter permease n=1 Tax=Clostridium rhizosphaerae TaxID=2803861 RepID=A0ABS1T6X9_9CLOT|nr:ABC transporter permease [Clostridium rhizosphaerae]MBL4935099.1 ABC transporter permease [Clostridium rhizosphaerae]